MGWRLPQGLWRHTTSSCHDIGLSSNIADHIAPKSGNRRISRRGTDGRDRANTGTICRVNPSSMPVLVVDLDNTLLRSDILHEMLLSAMSRNLATPAIAISALFKGKVAFKERLQELSEFDVATLPYNDKVVEMVKGWRKSGGRTALATASPQLVAERISDHLQMFDEVHGSIGSRNLKGAAKGQFLVERFGEKGFAYVGDSSVDLAVWQRSAHAITVTRSDRLHARAAAAAPLATRLDRRGGLFRPMLRSLRPHQWLKNLLVFIPALAAHRFDVPTLLGSALAFIGFCLIASGSYIINDLLDIEADRQHINKRSRPLASGELPIAMGASLGGLALIAGLGISAWFKPDLAILLAFYFLLTTTYSLWLKRHAIIDIAVLSALYSLRIFAGAVATSIAISVWLLAFSIFFFLSLAAVKRQAELISRVEQGKLELSTRGYRGGDIPLVGSMIVCSGMISSLVIVLYASSTSVRLLYRSPEWMLGVAFILLYWICRVAMITHRGQMHDDPVIFAARDRTSYVLMVLVIGMLAIGALF